MSNELSQPPIRLFLQWNGDAEPDETESAPSIDDVTWCYDRVFAYDVEYVRVDQHSRANAQLQKALHVIADQYDAAGGQFLTPDADLTFKECFCRFGETVPDALRRLLSENAKVQSRARHERS